MDHLGGIGFFVRAAEAGSFAAAAKALGVTPSAVSKAVARLEDRLSAQLFRRSTRSIDLTDDGRAFFERARAGLSEIEDAEAFLLERRATPRGRLRVSMPVVFGHRLVAPLLPGLLAAYPELEIETHSTDGFSDLIEDGFDVLIRTGRLSDSSLIARKLIDTRFVTAASPDYLAARGVPTMPEDLSNHACAAYVFPTSRRIFAWPFERAGAGFTIVATGGPAFTNADAMIAACEAGAGLLHLQDYMLGPSLAAGRLVPVLSDYAADGGPVSAVYQSSRHLSPKVRAFVDHLAGALR
ncbi:MAG: LysR substrate-binding domain-containing protein [Pseudomonadota bacterium]